jgi:hypothetical protein
MAPVRRRQKRGKSAGKCRPERAVRRNNLVALPALYRAITGCQPVAPSLFLDPIGV